MKKIVIDENIIFAEDAFAECGETVLLPGREITDAALEDADALIVRSTTDVDENLLAGTNVQFVGTATIGTDHIDKNYLAANNIRLADAAGCNADAVAEYVFTGIMHVMKRRGLSFSELTLGIIGVGNIGKRVAKLANACGLQVFLNDPPRAEAEGAAGFSTLEETLKADIITCHVPMAKDGAHPTFHLIDADALSCMRDEVIFINASRGAVVDNKALKSWLKNHANASIILDVWENEPDIDVELLALCELGTPHIAGYSLEGKINGTAIILEKLCAFWQKEPEWQAHYPAIENNVLHINHDFQFETILAEACAATYPISHDDGAMRDMRNEKPALRGRYFDQLRKTYPLRREFFNYTVSLDPMDIDLSLRLQQFRFKMQF